MSKKDINQLNHSLFHEVLERFNQISYIKSEDIPDIPLYMDQVTSFMDTRLEDCKRYPEDKILTKTMINNYTKNKLIPPPEKKKYSKEHVILLLYVYYLKDFMSIDDIAKVLKPLENDHFQAEQSLSMTEIYEQAVQMVRGEVDHMSKDLFHKWQKAKQLFPEQSEEEPYLDIFSYICLLSFEVYVKKQLIEHLIDAIPEEETKTKKKK